MLDKIKLFFAGLLAAAGTVGYYLLPDLPTLVRVLMIVVGLIAGGVVAYFTRPGKAFFAFAVASRDEIRKVVWPTRKETVQTTGVVLTFVFVMAIFLWIVDSSLLWIVRLALGQGD